MAVENNKHWWQASLLTEQSNYNNFQNIFIFFYFILFLKLYKIVLVLPNIKMNPHSCAKITGLYL